MNITVDASVAVKWILEEEKHFEATALLDDRVRLDAPTLLLAEVGNVIWRRVRLGRFDGATGCTAFARVRSAIDRFHALEALSDEALEISLDLDHPIYDCFYLACAERADTGLVTADKRLAAAVAGSAFAHRVQLLS